MAKAAHVYAKGKIPKKWLRILLAIPGYDPRNQAEDCRFDADAAQQALDFFPECLKHVKGEWAGQPFILELWQKAIVANVYGWKRPDGTRRFRKVWVYVPRKNGKTAFLAGQVLYLLLCENEPGAEVYSTASDREQASLIHGHVQGMVEQEPEIDRRVTMYKTTRAIVRKDNTGAYKPLSSDVSGKHGYNASGAVHDEVHADPTGKLMDVIDTSMGTRREPLSWYISTADFARPSKCNTMLKHARNVRDNGGHPNKIGWDPSFLPVIYEAQTMDDWADPKVWKRVNPNLGVSLKMEYMIEQCRKAQAEPSYENTFKRLHLNIVTEQAERWLPMDAWNACGGAVDAEALNGALCWAGLDLSSTTDTTSLVLFFPDQDNAAIPFFWIPEDRARELEERDRVPYLTWARQGLIELTPGNVIDYRYIRAKVNELSRRHQVKKIGYDPWNARQIALAMQEEDGLPMVEFRQGFITMNEPTKRLEMMVMGGTLAHGAHPVLDWQAANVAVRTDPAGNIKPDKEKSTEKIDGMVALVMAIGCWMADLDPVCSVYDERGAFWI